MWIRWGAVAAPVAIIGIFVTANRLSGPRPAAASNAVSSAPVGAGLVAPAKEVENVERWIHAHSESTNSPFLVAPILAPVKAEEPIEKPVAPILDGIRLSSVFNANGTAMASINGKLFRPGQEVRTGVTLVSVDARARKAVLHLSDGREVELTAGRQSKQREVEHE